MLHRQFTLNITILFLIFIPVFLSAQEDEKGLQWSGYFENQVFFEFMPEGKDLILLDYNKLRLDMAYEVSSSLTFNADIIFRTYHGTTSFNVVDFIPKDYGFEIPPEFEQFLVFNFEDNYYINDAYVTFYLGQTLIRIGKQQLPWGTGYTWNPTDNFNTKDQLDPTYEKEGVNAIKIEIPWGLDGFFQVIAYNRQGVDKPNYTAKIKKNFGGFDISTSYHYYQENNIDLETMENVEQKRHILGFDFTGQIFEVGIWGEGTYNWPDENDFYNKEYGEYLVGMDYTFGNELYLMAEYLHRDRGIEDPNNYSIGDFIRLMYGEITNIGTDYLAIGMNYPISEFINIQTYSIINIQDESWILIPWIVWDAAENCEISVASNLFFGPNNTEYGEYPPGFMARVRLYF